MPRPPETMRFAAVNSGQGELANAPDTNVVLPESSTTGTFSIPVDAIVAGAAPKLVMPTMMTSKRPEDLPLQSHILLRLDAQRIRDDDASEYDQHRMPRQLHRIDIIFANVDLNFGALDFPEALCVCRETCALFGGGVPAGCSKFLARQLFQRDAALEPSLEPGRLPTSAGPGLRVVVGVNVN